jgi:hypothetical protein
MAKINVDIAHDCNLGEFLELLEKHNLKMVDFTAIGPGGGNPNITFEGSYVNCRNFLSDDLYLDDEEIDEEGLYFIDVEMA